MIDEFSLNILTKDKLNTVVNAVNSTTDCLSVLPLIESDLDTLQTDMSTANSNLSTAQTDLNNAEADIIQMQSDLNTAETDIGNINLDIGTIQSDLLILSSSVPTLSGLVSTLNSNIASAELDLGTAQSDLGIAQSNISDINQDISDIQQDIIALYALAGGGGGGGGGMIQNLTVTVGSTGDYATISLALAYARTIMPSNGFKLTIVINSDYVTVNEQILIQDCDLSFIDIKHADYTSTTNTMLVQDSALTGTILDSWGTEIKPFIGGINAKLPNLIALRIRLATGSYPTACIFTIGANASCSIYGENGTYKSNFDNFSYILYADQMSIINDNSSGVESKYANGIIGTFARAFYGAEIRVIADVDVSNIDCMFEAYENGKVVGDYSICDLGVSMICDAYTGEVSIIEVSNGDTANINYDYGSIIKAENTLGTLSSGVENVPSSAGIVFRSVV